MKEFKIEIPEGKRAEWVNGVLTLVDEKPVEYKFQVGDRVKDKSGAIYTIIELFDALGEPHYKLKANWGIVSRPERWLELVPQDITEHIKTFEDACEWCIKHQKANLVNHYNDWGCALSDTDDVRAYLKLRIITAALNEGWEPVFKEYDKLWCVEYDCTDNICDVDYYSDWVTSTTKLLFKSKELAEYASVQFRDLYDDFFGINKGNEK